MDEHIDAPQVPPESLYLYGHKRAADDIKELARQLEAPKIILGGHDWGGSIVFRVALWHPDLVTHIFSVCTPYFPPTKDWVSLDDLVKRLPSLRYQVHLAGPEIEAHVKSKTEIKQFLNAMFGGRGPNGEVGFNTAEGIALDVLPKLGKTPLLSEQELDHYVEEYAKHGMHGPLNWYRTRQQNYEDELELSNSTISQPVLFISAARDAALPPALAQGMDHFIPHLTKKQVEAGHWALVQAAKHVNAFVGEWLSQVGFAEEGGGKSTL
ncbi:MAG: hypothetical protein M1838_004233 [Thelocarpon superellum]|nr:MAG: hypothetical protein M1838_004233 [Thelocarpon superellum]